MAQLQNVSTEAAATLVSIKDLDGAVSQDVLGASDVHPYFASRRNTAISAETLLIGSSLMMAEVRRIIRQIAPSDASVIVTGPTGSGKEVVARALHVESKRPAAPFIAVNTGAVPRDLLESELFGHEKGSFTGAINQRRGRFEEADGGTLFLDEIGDMPFEMQVKLLRVLEERTVQRVGGRGQIAVDTRIVSATHRDLGVAIEEQRFRADLYYRLAVFPIDLPSLAERREDVPELVRHFADRSGAKISFSPSALERLVAYDWPGNIRELRNVIERAAILAAGRVIAAEEVEALLAPQGRRMASSLLGQHGARALQSDLLAALSETRVEPIAQAVAAPSTALTDEPIDLRSTVAEIEQNYITEALKAADGVVAEAARLLTLQRTTLIEKMRKYGLKAA